MEALQAQDRYWHPNAHLLAALAGASRSGKLTAAHDIIDTEGTKLWSREQPVSNALQQKLLERRLVKPLESCLRIENGVTSHALLVSVRDLVATGAPVAPLVQPWIETVERQIESLPLHPVAQLLITTARESRPSMYTHAVAAMALAGAMAASAGWLRYDVRLALLGGLLHDIGELYLDPELVTGGRGLSLQGYRHLSVHPSVGAMLLSSLTDYPTVLHKAIAEHHERLDGTGYPLHSLGTSLSSLGRLLAVVEVATGVLESDRPWIPRASLALRIVPGEFEPTWVNFVERAARLAPEPGCDDVAAPQGDPIAALKEVDEMLRAAGAEVTAVRAAPQSAALAKILMHAEHALSRLRVGWNGAGMWVQTSAQNTAQYRFEAQVVVEEIRYRLGALKRRFALLGETLQGAEAESVRQLCSSLGDEA